MSIHRVILKKGPGNTRQWTHDDRASAARRAYALADLHNADVVEHAEYPEFWVDASAYYRKKQ